MALALLRCNVPYGIITNNLRIKTALVADADWSPGIYTKIAGFQVANPNTHFPSDYTTSSQLARHLNSMYGRLNSKTWLKGIFIECNWGEIELTKDNYNFDFLNGVFDKFELINKNKKIILALTPKIFKADDVAKCLPEYLRSENGVYGTTTIKRYDRLWAYSGNVQGWHFRLADFRNGLTGLDKAGDPIYTLRDRYYAFLEKVRDQFAHRPAFAGCIIIEPIGLNAIDPAELNRNYHFEGRLLLLKKLKQLFTKHLIGETANFDAQWVADTSGAGATDGMLKNKIAFCNPNYHVGSNIGPPLFNSMDNLFGKVPIIHQCQALDMDTKSGNVTRTGTLINDIYDWKPEPPNYGNPRTFIEQPDTVLNNDPPDGDWIIHRAIYLKSNYFIVQYDTADGPGGTRYHFDKFTNYMDNETTIISQNTGGLIKDDPAGGMFIAQPTYIV